MRRRVKRPSESQPVLQMSRDGPMLSAQDGYVGGLALERRAHALNGKSSHSQNDYMSTVATELIRISRKPTSRPSLKLGLTGELHVPRRSKSAIGAQHSRSGLTEKAMFWLSTCNAPAPIIELAAAPHRRHCVHVVPESLLLESPQNIVHELKVVGVICVLLLTRDMMQSVGRFGRVDA